MYKMLLYDEASYIHSKILQSIRPYDIDLFEATSLSKLSHATNGGIESMDIILADINFDNETLIEWLENYMHRHPFTPLIIYTSKVTRKTLASGIRLGAKDYVLKSSDTQELMRRVMHHLAIREKASNFNLEEVTFDLKSYLSSEIRKAQKGNYPVSLCVSMLEPISPKIEVTHMSYEDGKQIINRIRTHYWETDLLFQYGPTGFISFFPFCDSDQVTIVDDKLSQIFDVISENEVNLRSLKIKNMFVTYPNDGLKSTEILTKLENLMIASMT